MCPHILRYLTTAVITNKDVRKRRQVLKDLVKVIQQVRTEISTSFCSFSLKLCNFILMCLFWDYLHIQCWFFFFPSYWCHSLRSKMCINKFCFPSPHKTKCRKFSKMLEMVLNHSLFFFSHHYKELFYNKDTACISKLICVCWFMFKFVYPS